ncbi:50S ribosomal protein L20 [Planctomicrobium sp.]|jgi:large subunit ribosomal protein L20|nr:50S ribosomal protein L20 [Planctomicrobium sp.]MBT5019178.1 50S ribosomal protein L20 [Planctomicrobium sp.]MDB4439399.1 50S ribosomal protein L20 [Planctomicrobium sp.]MDB4743028.1 50S ribosomal protein L20 [Planctomicrobium sp.]
MRVKYGKARRKKKKRIFKEAKGNFGGRSKLWRTVQETVLRSRAYAYRDRRVRKRDFRSLWITRITAAARARGLRYSELMYGLRLAEIEVNRKMLSEIAIHNPEVFDELVAKAKDAISKK